MKDQEILNALKSACHKITPNNIDGLITELERKEKPNMSKEKPKKKFWIYLAPVLATCLIIAVVVGFTFYNNNQNSLISFDVNPSITLEVNNKEVITKVTALNDDAGHILEGIKLENVDLNTGVHAIIGSMMKHGYVDELKNSILVTVQNKDEEEGHRLETKLTNEIDEILASYKIEGAILSQTITSDKNLTTAANDNNITVGKAKLINEIIAKNPLYTFEELAKLNIQELNLIANSQTTQIETIEFKGSANESEYIGRDKAKSIAIEHAKVNESDVIFTEVEYDYDDGFIVYEVEFRAKANEYDYKINAKTGDIINYNKEIEDDYYEEQDKTNSDKNDGSVNKDNNDDKNESNTNTNNNTSNTDKIGTSTALNNALKDAGLSKSQVSDISVEYDYENGRAVYEVEFESKSHDYEYIIDANTGKVIHKEIDD